MEKAHSKIPLFRENLDNTTGLLYTKHLLPTEDNLEKPLKEFKREVAFIPQTLNLEDLLEEFKQKRTQLFMVVDEHGGTSGLVTYSDFLSWLLGEMVEEWSPESDIKAVGKNIYLIDASVNIEVLAQKFGLKLPEDYEYSTLGGYLMDQFKGIPSRGDVFETGHLKFVVEEIENNRIKMVKLVVRN